MNGAQSILIEMFLNCNPCFISLISENNIQKDEIKYKEKKNILNA